MSFAPVLAGGGLSGWLFLKRTLPAQQAAAAASTEVKREEAYFREKIGSINTAAELVADRRLLKVALEAFGLGEDINNRFFIQKVLADGTFRQDALANRLADKRYKAMAEAFGFGNFAIPRSQQSDFADKVLPDRRAQVFETAVGAQDQTMRLALQATRELPGIAAGASSDATKWFTILGNTPLRKVFEAAFGLPATFGLLDIDKQLQVFRERAATVIGSSQAAALADPAKVEALVRRFIARTEAQGVTAASGNGAALTLLQSGQRSLTGYLATLAAR